MPCSLAGLLLLVSILGILVSISRVTQKVTCLRNAAASIAAVAWVKLLSILVDNDLAVDHVIAESRENILVIRCGSILLPVCP